MCLTPLRVKGAQLQSNFDGASISYQVELVSCMLSNFEFSIFPSLQQVDLTKQKESNLLYYLTGAKEVGEIKKKKDSCFFKGH